VHAQRGSITLFVLALMPFLLVFAGLAVDLAIFMTTQGEVQRSVEASALAGAGMLGFDGTAFPDVRQAAHDYSVFNGLHLAGAGQSSELSPGDITLGIWDPAKPAGVGVGNRFEPSEDAKVVNAVLCQKQVQVPTAFLRLAGMDSLTVSALSVATSTPPREPAPGEPVLPVGISGCPFLEVDGNCQAAAFPVGGAAILAAWFPDATSRPPAGNSVIGLAIPTAAFLYQVRDVLNASPPGEPPSVWVPVLECPGGGPITGNQQVAAWAKLVILDIQPPLPPLGTPFDPSTITVMARYDCRQRLAPFPVGGPAPRAGLSRSIRVVR